MSLTLRPTMLPFITVDDLRSVAAQLSKRSRQELLRCLASFPRRTRVWRWDDEVVVVTEVRIHTRSKGVWRLRYGPTDGRWRMDQVGKTRWTSLAVQPAGDIRLEYRGTYRQLAALRKQLRSRVPRPGPWSQAEARAELHRLLEYSSPEDGPLDVDRDLDLMVRDTRGRLHCRFKPFGSFVRGQFSAAALAKEIVAARYRGTVKTLERVLDRGGAHYLEAWQAKRNSETARD